MCNVLPYLTEKSEKLECPEEPRLCQVQNGSLPEEGWACRWIELQDSYQRDMSKWRDTRWSLTFLRKVISRYVNSRFLYILDEDEDADPSKEMLSKVECAVKPIQRVDYLTRVWDKQRQVMPKNKSQLKNALVDGIHCSSNVWML